MVERASLDSLPDRKKQPLFEEHPRTVRVQLEAGGEIAEHSHPGTSIVFFVVEGSLELRLDDESFALSAGEMVRFDGERTISGVTAEPTTAMVVLVEE
jgi:quercetin dioxygenase-like cupin family protein